MPLGNQLPKSAAIVIVGGGVIGLAVARALALKGITDVLVLERGDLGCEASWAAAGMLAPQVEADEQDDFFRLACSSRDLYPSFAAALLDETGVDVELDVSGTLFLAFTESDENEMGRRYEWQAKSGLSVQKLTATEARYLEPSISTHLRMALRFPEDFQVENRRLVNALISSCDHHGVQLVTNTTALSLVQEHHKVKGVETSLGIVTTDEVVVAGGAWTSAINGLPDVMIEPVRGQMLCFKPRPQLVRHVIYSPRGYILPRRDGRLLAGSTTEFSGFSKTVTSAGIDAIRAQAAEISPQIESLTLVDSWAGLRPRSSDSLPVLGPCGEIDGLVYATGHYRNGILLAPITGELIASLIVDKAQPTLMRAFSADRFGMVSAK